MKEISRDFMEMIDFHVLVTVFFLVKREDFLKYRHVLYVHESNL